MARCANCFKASERAFCSLDCAIERWSIMLEGVELLDAMMRMVDEAAEKRAARVVTPAASPSKGETRRKPSTVPTADAGAQSTMSALLVVNGPDAPLPNGLDAPG